MANICKMWVIFDVSPTFDLLILNLLYNFFFYKYIRIYAYAGLSTVCSAMLSTALIILQYRLSDFCSVKHAFFVHEECTADGCDNTNEK